MRPQRLAPSDARAAAAFAALSVALVACASDVDTYCDRTCKKQASCTPGTDVAACKDACAAAHQNALAVLRSEYVSAYTDCYAKSACNALDACKDSARGKLAPSAACRSFCAQYVPALQACGKPVYASPDVCTSALEIYTDDAMKKAIACLSQSCDGIASCVKDALVPP